MNISNRPNNQYEEEMMTPKSNTRYQRDTHDEVVLQGASICPGIGFGQAYLVDPVLPIMSTKLTPQQVRAEKERYTAAVNATKHLLHEHITIVHGDETPDTKAILHVHEAILNDDSFHDLVRKRIAADKNNAEWSLWQEGNDLISRFSAMRDPYFAARSEDIRDMAYNLLGVLSGGKSKASQLTEKERVFASYYLHSSDAMLAQRRGSVGFASESHTLVSHAAILLKGFGIPSVAGIKGLTDYVKDGDSLIVDGTNGIVIIRPNKATQAKYRSCEKDSECLGTMNSPTCIASDGTRIVLKANIESPEQVKLMIANKLEGIGLFRTEFLISATGSMPTEEEQFKIYTQVIEQAAGAPVVIRTFDIGGDKSMGLSDKCGGRNPALGLRGIRRHLAESPEELQAQLRAILRAAGSADVGILIPMVTTIEDIVAMKQHLDSVKEEMHKTGIAWPPNIKIGAMIETPAAAALTKAILSEVDFVSLGSNDLLQYFMAADRDNERVIQYLDAANPAFLWLLKHIITEAKKIGREMDITVCGEVATDVRILPHLLCMGYRAFSIPPVSASIIKRFLTK